MKIEYFALMRTSRWRLKKGVNDATYFKEVSSFEEPITEKEYWEKVGSTGFTTGIGTELVFTKEFIDHGCLVVKIENMNPESTKKTITEFKFDFERSF